VRILIVTLEYPPYLRGGIGTHVSSLVANLQERGHELVVLTFSPNRSSIEREGSVEVVRVACEKGDLSRFDRDSLSQFYVYISDEFARTALSHFEKKGWTPQVIHCHDFHGFEASSRLRRALHAPIVSSVHLLHHPLMHWGGEEPPSCYLPREKAMCIESDHLITVCSGFEELIHQIYAREATSTTCIHNGVSIDETWERRGPQQGNELCEIVFVGRFTAQKSIKELLLSAIEVSRLKPNVRYRFAGYFENTSYARAVRCALSGLEFSPEKIVMTGRLSRSEVHSLLKNADICMLPSRYEGVPYSALEAMSHEVPVIGGDTCGITDLIAHETTGLLCPVHLEDVDDPVTSKRNPDLSALVEEQIRLIDNVDLRRSLGKAGKERVIRKHSIKQMVDSVVQVYNTLV